VVPPWLGSPLPSVAGKQKNPPVMTTGDVYEPASLFSGTALVFSEGDTLCLDNGGNSGSDYLPVLALGIVSAAPRPIRRWRAGGILTFFPLSGPSFQRVLFLFAACRFF
jgi:hypothetical protein